MREVATTQGGALHPVYDIGIFVASLSRESVSSLHSPKVSQTDPNSRTPRPVELLEVSDDGLGSSVLLKHWILSDSGPSRLLL